MKLFRIMEISQDSFIQWFWSSLMRFVVVIMLLYLLGSCPESVEGE